MVASEKNRVRHFKPTIRANIRIAEFYFKMNFLNSHKLQFLIYLFRLVKFQIYEDIGTIITVASPFFAQFNNHAALLCGPELLGMPLALFPRKNAFPTIFNASP